MSSYTKLFGTITASTIWAEDSDTRVVWITMLAMCDRNGEVAASIPGLANIAQVPLIKTEEALSKFMGPDKYSRTKDFEGRRIEEIPGGWVLLNHASYRAERDQEARKEYRANWMREKRQKDREQVSEQNEPACTYPDTNTNTDTNTEEKGKSRQQVATISPLAKSADADDYREFASRMWISIQSLTNQQKAPNLETWADEIRKLIEIDRQPLPVAWEVFNWANKDKFWQGNILSAANFRKHFPKLYAQSRGDAPVDFSAIARNHKEIF